MDLNRELLSQVIIFDKYAKYLYGESRRETWTELVTRNKEMHCSRYPALRAEIDEAYEYVYQKKVLPSMRSLQFGGKPIELCPSRGYNCSFLPINDYHAFSETMFLLLGGTGVGYSVQQHHIAELPTIKKPGRARRYLIGDSIEGWADAVKALMKAYLVGGSLPTFDLSGIRKKGMRLVTSGGKAPGPEPLKVCLFQVQKILDRKEPGTQLSSLECHDILCHIAEAVLAGGIRRAAMISLFSLNDQDMLTCKFGNWSEQNPQRGRSNNSAVALRSRITRRDFFEFWEKVRASGAGEPGINFTNDKDYGINPCAEIALRPFGFCNLTEINGSVIRTQEELDGCAKAAAFIGTLQASYTDFHYLRDIWRRTAEKDALLGVGITGIATGGILALNLTQAALIVNQENERVAAILGIRKAARTTCIKPSGTTSLVLGCSSGIHAWHNDYYIRRLRVGKHEALYQYLAEKCPGILEDDFFKPLTNAIIQVPIRAPEGAILRSEPALSTLERVKDVTRDWIQPGHRQGPNTHNVSCTISVKPDEWDEVGEWMWKNREHYTSIAVLPYDGGTYTQAPFEDCTRETYDRLSKMLTQIDLSEIIETDDLTDLSGELACFAGQCELPPIQEEQS